VKCIVVTLVIAAAVLSAAPTAILQPQPLDPASFGFGNGNWQPARAGVPTMSFSGEPGTGAVFSGRFWDLPVPINGEAIESFDVDFDDSTGIMWLALAPDGDSLVRFYNSTDHGRSWSNAYDVEISPHSRVWPMHVVVGAGDSNYVHAFIRVEAAMGDLYDIRLRQDLSHMDVQPVQVGRDTFTRFDVCRDNRPDYGLYVFTSNSYLVTFNAVFLRSFDYGRTWDRQVGNDVRQPALCAGAGTYIHMACVHARDRGLGYQCNSNRGDPTSWLLGSELGTDTCLISDPKVAVATTMPESLATAWVLYSHSNRNSADWDVDYAVRSDSWGSSWRKHQQLTSSPAAEHIADVRNDRESDNIYVDAMFVVSDTAEAESAVVKYSWANTDAPRSWFAPLKVSDTLRVSPELLPTLVFSPGAAEFPVPGVVFSGYGEIGAYFNATWFETGAAEKTAPDFTVAIAVSSNPSRGPVRFAPGVPVAEILSIRIFDAIGKLVRNFPPAANVSWDGRDRAGRPLSTGAYIIRVTTARGAQQTKVLLTR